MTILIPSSVLAQDGALAESTSKDNAISLLQGEYKKFGLEDEDAQNRAKNAVEGLIDSMGGDQYDAASTYESLENQVHGMPTQGERREEATYVLEDEDNDYNAKKVTEHFTELDPENYIKVYGIIAGSPPYVTPSEAFENAHKSSTESISVVRRVLINPTKPGSVPEGDIISDFIPQIIRQLYRFAWVAILLSFTVSGILFVVAQDNDERITKARSMLYYSLVGFAFIAFSFAMVKALTDIDFFRFI